MSQPSGEALGSVLDAMSELVVRQDLEFRILWANRAACDSVGARLEDLLGRYCYEVWAGRRAPCHECPVAKAGRDGQSREEETATPDGRVWLIRAVPVRDARGQITEVVEIAREITAQRRAEAALRRSEERFRQLSEAAFEGIAIIRESRLVDVNSRFAEMFGCGPAELIGQELSSCVAPQSRELVRARLQTESLDPFEHWALRRDGTTFLVEVRVRSVAGDGEALRVVAVRDLTAKKAAEEHLVRLATAIEQAWEVVVITDQQGTIQYVNPAFERLTGYSRQEAIGQNPRILKSGKHDAEFYAQLWRALSSGETWTGQFINRRKDGTLMEEHAVISPVRDAGGQIVNYVAVKRDITEERRREAQLRQAQKMEAIGQLAGGVAHDFNNILQAVIGCTHLAAADLPDGHAALEQLQEVLQAADRARVLVRRLLAFGRRETYQPRQVDLSPLVAKALSLLRRLVGQHLELDFTAGPRLWPVQVDPAQLEQVLVILCANARDAMPGGGKVLIETANVEFDATFSRTHAWARPGRFVRLSVSDTGAGMAPAVQEHIFEPFFTTKGFGQGTGLGLATVYGIVKQHDGLITFDSAPGSGTVFHLYLPAADSASGTSGARDKPAGQEGGETILIAEDEEQVRLLALRLLGREGYRLLLASDGEEAIRLFEAHADQIDLAILDVVMPKQGGRAVYEAIRRRRAELPVLFSSGYGGQHVELPGTRDGTTELVHKPYTPGELLAKVQQALRRAAARPSGPQPGTTA